MQYLQIIADYKNLESAFRHIRSNRGGPGLDDVSLQQFAAHLSENLEKMSHDLLHYDYTFSPSLAVYSTKLQRKLSILTVQDRVLHQAIAQIISPVIEKTLHHASFAYRLGHSAVKAVNTISKTIKLKNHSHVLRCDIRKFFDEVDHNILLSLLRYLLPENKQTISLIHSSISGKEMHDGQIKKRSRGLLQGSSLSPCLSNLYLTVLDRYIEKAGFVHFRFCDDITVLLKNVNDGKDIENLITRFLHNYLKLQLHPQKTQIYSTQNGFDFLGFRITSSGVSPSRKSRKKLNKNLQNAEQSIEHQQQIQGWCAYYGNDNLKDNIPFIKLFRNYFRGAKNYYAKSYKKGKERYGYQKVREPLNDRDIVLHLLGKEKLGIYLLEDDHVSCSCLDLDISKRIMDTVYHTDTAKFSVYEDRILQHARTIESFLQQHGFGTLLEFSGYRGYHLWLFFTHPVSAKYIIEFWFKILKRFSCPKGVKREVFPREAHNWGRSGSLIKLPLGHHPHSGNRSYFLDKSGEPVTNPMQLIQNTKKHDVHDLQKNLSPQDKNDNAIAKVKDGCYVVKYLCEKAERENDLAHFERLILLYTIGQLGQEGQQELHRIISKCYNYDAQVTQKKIDSKYPTPMSCYRIHEIMGQEVEKLECCCTFDIPPRGYASPILHAYPSATKNLSRRDGS